MKYGKPSWLICLIYLASTTLSWAQQRPNQVVSPELLADGSVIFRLKAPNAKSIRPLGTWLKDLRNTVEMTRKDSSVLETEIGPLPADMYEYRFIVDGIPRLDPGNNVVTRDSSIIIRTGKVKGAQLGQLVALPDGAGTQAFQLKRNLLPNYLGDFLQLQINSFSIAA